MLYTCLVNLLGVVSSLLCKVPSFNRAMVVSVDALKVLQRIAPSVIGQLGEDQEFNKLIRLGQSLTSVISQWKRTKVITVN